jgi:hypothetical protein
MTTEVANCHAAERRLDEPAKSFLAWLPSPQSQLPFPGLKVARSNAQTRAQFHSFYRDAGEGDSSAVPFSRPHPRYYTEKETGHGKLYSVTLLSEATRPERMLDAGQTAEVFLTSTGVKSEQTPSAAR